MSPVHNHHSVFVPVTAGNAVYVPGPDLYVDPGHHYHCDCDAGNAHGGQRRHGGGVYTATQAPINITSQGSTAAAAAAVVMGIPTTSVYHHHAPGSTPVTPSSNLMTIESMDGVGASGMHAVGMAPTQSIATPPLPPTPVYMAVYDEGRHAAAPGQAMYLTKSHLQQGMMQPVLSHMQPVLSHNVSHLMVSTHASIHVNQH